MPVSPVSPWDALPTELQTRIATHLPAADLIALAQASRTAQAAATPLWQDAYGAFPCHRTAETPRAWQRAVVEQVGCQARLLAPLQQLQAAGLQPPEGAIQGRAARVLQHQPLWAYVGLQALGPALYTDDAALKTAIGALCSAALPGQAKALARQGLARRRDAASDLMQWAAKAGYGQVCEAGV